MQMTKQVWEAALRGLQAVTEKGIWQEKIFEAENENMKKHANSKCLCSASPCSEWTALKHEMVQQKFRC